MEKLRAVVAALLVVNVLALSSGAHADEGAAPRRDDRLAFGSFMGGGVLLTLAGGYLVGEGIFAYRKSGTCFERCAGGTGSRAGVSELVLGTVGMAAGLALIGLGLKVHLEVRRELALVSVEGRF